MSMGLMIEMTLVGMGLIALLSFALYTLLPRAALDFATEHGRYAGLGIRDELVGPKSGNRPIVDVHPLQGHAA
jgi:hypothetical protein